MIKKIGLCPEIKVCSFLILVFALILSACGLDTFYYLDSPLFSTSPVTTDNEELVKNFFSCRTNEESSSGNNHLYFDSSSDFRFLGTEIYYKIYNNKNTMLSVESTVDNMISSTTSYSSAADYLIETKGYKSLKISSGSTPFPLVKATSSPNNRHVYIRLNNSDNGDFRSAICIGESPMTCYVGGTSLSVGGVEVAPRRNSNSAHGFDFSTSDEANPVPSDGDSDVEYSSSATESGVWFVDMYAVSVGRDATYTNSYSQPYRMGAIKITVSGS